MKGNIKNAWASAFLVFIAAFLGIILVQPFTVNAVDDTTAPEITYIGPTPANSTKINVNYVNVTVGITDSGNISVVLLEWNGVNNTMMNIAPGTWSLVMTNLSDGEYTYRVYANDTDGNMGISNMRVVTVSVSVTTYNYPLVLPGQYCLITLPLNDTTVTKASELAVKIGDNCTEVVKWDSSAQLYESYIPGVPLNDFDIRGGEGYFVNVNNPTNVVVTGKSWESPFTLSLAAGYNLIGIPLNDTTVTKASELAVKIGDNCTEVVKWDSSAQLYESYIPGVPLNDFDIRGGEGYFVNVNNPTSVVISGEAWKG